MKVCEYCKKEYIIDETLSVYARATASRFAFCSIRCRFLTKVDKTENCWLWRAGLSDQGYGQFSVGHKGYVAHRYSWILHKGDIPNGLMACHTCDNKLCVNPDHLFLGTQKDNCVDKQRKGRAQAEMRCYNCKLTDEQVAEILQDNRTYKELALVYNVSVSLINKIRCGYARTLVKIKRKKKDMKGQNATRAKLTNEQVLAIRADTRNWKEVIMEYGISNSTYYAIRAREYWKHI